ncbi:MAG: ROK family protein [Usitatibacter sp.]
MGKDRKESKKGAKRAFIGGDIGGTKTLFALLDEHFEVVAEEKLRSHPEKGGIRAFERGIAGAIKALMREAGRRGLEVRVAGVGCAGRIDLREGVVRRAPNLEFLEGYELRARIEKLTGAPTFVANDVVTGLYGEHRLGAARKARHVIGVWLGTGVGGAVIIGGRLHLGADGVAGDIGNYMLHTMDATRDTPRKEVLDNVASRTAIVGDAAVLAAKRRAPELRRVAGTDVDDIKSGDIAEAIRGGDKDVEKLVRSRAAVLGAALSNLVDFLNPDMVVLGGGLVVAMPQLLRREIAKSIRAHASPRAARRVKVAVAKLGNHAGTIGAAALAVAMFSRNPPIEIRRV